MSFADMSGELQTIPARHGVATFVPRGRTIKVINTYGKQVVSMWAFSLGAPPDKEEDGMDEEKVQEEAEGEKKIAEVRLDGSEETKDMVEKPKVKGQETKEKGDAGKYNQVATQRKGSIEEDAEDTPEQAPTTPDDEKLKEDLEATEKQASKRTWVSYLPSIPYRNKNATSKPDTEKNTTADEEKAQNEVNTRKWSSYIPTGKSFSSYVPNVQIPDSKEAVSSFKASHHRDPNKSYAEQLYDFSKTPVGAGTIAAATGSGYASSVYAAYSAYTSTHPSSSHSQPPMEYLSLPHTRASTHKLVPSVADTLLTNLRNPILTLIEDTSPGTHDTLTAACDANQYTALGVDAPAEHGSCAENLVLALKEVNSTTGLKGARAIGADVSVNIAPTPLHLFMNASLKWEDAQSQGSGARAVTLKVEEPQGAKRTFVRFKAERDAVVVLSACPMDVGVQNGGRCMAANFLVEDIQDDNIEKANFSTAQQKTDSKTLSQSKNRDGQNPKSKARGNQNPQEQGVSKDGSEERKEVEAPSAQDEIAETAQTQHKPQTTELNEKPSFSDNHSNPRKKPRKLQKRGSAATETAPTSS